jgi:RimJ/RimL family protein N-acetyltransferase
MLKVFSADESDITWMYRLFIQAANNRHFIMQNDRQGRERIKRNLVAIVLQQNMIDYNRRTQTMVFENETGKVGYVIMSEIQAGKGGNEIHVFVVDKQMRGNGYGRLMLNEVVSRWHPYADLHARVFPASTRMANLLQGSQFLHEGKNSEGADKYRLPRMT